MNTPHPHPPHSDSTPRPVSEVITYYEEKFSSLSSEIYHLGNTGFIPPNQADNLRGHLNVIFRSLQISLETTQKTLNQ